MRLLALLLILVAPLAVARNVDVPFQWEQVCSTVEGDDLDLDNDGVCELLTAFRFYYAISEAGDAFIDAIPETGARNHSVRINLPWGNHCFKMTAVIITEDVVSESDFSNVGACIDVQPGRPVAPVLF